MQWLFDILAQIPDAHRNTIIAMMVLALICLIYACIHALIFRRPASSASTLMPAYFFAAACVIGYVAFHYTLLTVEL